MATLQPEDGYFNSSGGGSIVKKLNEALKAQDLKDKEVIIRLLVGDDSSSERKDKS